MASAAFAAVNPFLRRRTSPEEAPNRMPEWKRLIVACDQKMGEFIHEPSERNRRRIEEHLLLMGCSNSRKVKAKRKAAQSMYKELTHGH
jgi:hypothetical protein